MGHSSWIKPLVELDQLVPVHVLRQNEWNFRAIFGFTVVFERLDGRIITEGESYNTRPFACESCRFISRREGFEVCRLSDEEASLYVARSRAPLLYKCRAKFSNFAIPVKAEGKTIANLFGGQLLVLPPENELEKEAFNRLRRELQVTVLRRSGDFIKEGFFYDGEHLHLKEIKEIARESGFVGVDMKDFKQALKQDLRIQRGQIKSFSQFLHDFRILANHATVISDWAQAIYDFKKKGLTELKSAFQPTIPVDSEPWSPIQLRIDVPIEETLPERLAIKAKEIEVLTSFLPKQNRLRLAQFIKALPNVEPEIKKILVKSLKV